MNESNIKNLERLLRQSCNGRGRSFSELEVQQFLAYYGLILKWNSRLHLTTIIDPEQFFNLNIVESGLVESLLLPAIERIYDLGSGLGIPGIPLAIMCPNIEVNLIEIQRNKAFFLEETAYALNLKNVIILNSRLELLSSLSAASCITARAVEQFEKIIPTILKIGSNCEQILFLSSDSLLSAIQTYLKPPFQFSTHPILGSKRRYVYSLVRST